jgi:hypothetical protein
VPCKIDAHKIDKTVAQSQTTDMNVIFKRAPIEDTMVRFGRFRRMFAWY